MLEIDLKLNKVSFLTTVYPMNEKYLYDFFNSLKNQTCQNFDVVVINDGYKKFDKIKNDHNQNLNIIEIPCSSTPAKNREYGINYCIDQKYEILIFGDSDDYFQNNRIQKSLELLKKTDVVVNDLSLFNNKGIYEKKYLSKRLNNLDVINFQYIKDKNIFGLTNTALKLKNIKKVVFEDEIVAVDWYFFQKILKQGFKAIFTNETISYYRQYENNSVGLSAENNKYYLWWEKR